MYKPKLHVPDQLHYASPFLDIFDLVNDPDKADVIMFTGGADINPAIYDEPRGRYTDHPSARDMRELRLYERTVDKKKFLGICRGAQLLCALAGGKVAQDIEGHVLGFSGFHRVNTSDGKELQMNSFHHQMMVPWAVEHEMLAWSEKLSSRYLDGYDKPITGIEVEPEVVYFPGNKALGIQCHPESGYPDAEKHPSIAYFKSLIRERLL